MKTIQYILAAGLLLARAVPSSAQTIGGTVVDRTTQRPVSNLAVSLMDRDSVMNRSRTDSAGVFYLLAPRAGVYQLRIGGEGPDQAVVDSISVGVEDFFQRTFLISPRHVYLDTEVDQQVVPSLNVAPRYPQNLRESHTEGRVVVQFVVDTTGSVVPGSLKILDATHPEFADALRVTIPQMHFLPALLKGKKVAQMVQQPFSFGLAR